MDSKFCGFIPFRSEADWWASFSDNLATCCGCGRDFQECDLSEVTGLCGDCDRTLDDAIVIIEDECEDEPVWCERRGRVEAYLSARGM